MMLSLKGVPGDCPGRWRADSRPGSGARRFSSTLPSLVTGENLAHVALVEDFLHLHLCDHPVVGKLWPLRGPTSEVVAGAVLAGAVLVLESDGVLASDCPMTLQKGSEKISSAGR